MTNIQNMGRFTVALPEGWQAELKGKFLFMSPEQLQRRYGLYSLSLESDAPKLSPVETRGAFFFYKTSTEGGGSGGPEHFLTIWRADDENWIVLEANQQTDPAPDFDEAWSIIESVEVK